MALAPDTKDYPGMKRGDHRKEKNLEYLIEKRNKTMTLKVKTRRVDDVIVFDMLGRLTCGEPQMLLRNTLRQYVDEGNRKLVLNLSDVSFVDSSGLGELVSIKNLMTQQEGQIGLLGLTNKVRDLLVMTKLVCVFDCFEDESRAISAVQSEGESKSLTAG